MDRERLRRVREVFEGALSLPPWERDTFVSASSAGDAALREEVESLLAAHSADGAVLDRLGERITSLAELLDETPQRRVGPYEIIEEAGRGGMGVVYRAHDPRLRRDIALKFLPRIFGRHPTARARFIEEARAASALDHAGICTIHDIGSTDDDRLYIAMAWYGGGTLADRLRDGPLSVPEAVRIAIDVAGALERAHRAGIVHRDIKPANIAFGESGQTKILDFGVAALEADATPGIAGTPRYMSPEQLQGGAVDRRTDIRALAVVLYEMLIGHPAFDGDDGPTVSDAVVHADARTLDWSTMPPALAAVLVRALATDPADRHATATEFAGALRSAVAPPSVRSRLTRAPVVAALAFVIVVSVFFATRTGSRGGTTQPDAGAVAVLPFRISGDASLAYLREGMVDLLAAKLTGEGGLRAADPRTVYSVGGDLTAGGSDLAPDSARALARRIGAGNVLLGDVVGTSEHIVINTTMLDLRGRVVGRASAQGAPASLTELVDRLAAQLLSMRAGEEPQRMAVLTTTSLPALRAFLDGQAAYRRGRYENALRDYGRALELDTTFALAGLGLELAAGWVGSAAQTREIARDVAWRYRDRLAPADRALLAAAIGPEYPGPSTTRQIIASIEEGLRLAPDRVELWYMQADAYLHYGRVMDVADWEARAEAGFRRAIELDSTFAPSMHHLILLYAHSVQLDRMREAAATQLAREPDGASADFIHWLRAAAAGERDMEPRPLESLAVETLGWIIMISQDDGFDPGVGRRAAQERAARAGMAVERFERNLALHAVALNHGRPQEALAITERLRDEQPDPDYYLRLRILDGLYADGDTVAAARAADELAQITAVRRGADQSVDIARRMNRCVLDQWLSTTGAAVVGSSAPRSGGVATSAVVICEAAAHALREVTAGTRSAGPATARFDSLLVDGPFDLPVGDGSIEYANSALARAWEIAGEPDRALAAIGRRLYFLGWQASLAASLRHEARLAEQQGDTQRARIATQHYNALRYDPEPGLHAELRGRERR